MATFSDVLKEAALRAHAIGVAAACDAGQYGVVFILRDGPETVATFVPEEDIPNFIEEVLSDDPRAAAAMRQATSKIRARRLRHDVQ
jgi:hypothetical protein